MLVPRALAILGFTAALGLPFAAGCSGSSSSSEVSTASSSAPHRTTFTVVVLDEKPDPFATLPPPVPKGISSFQEVVVLSPDDIQARTYVRLVVQGDETLDQARARAKPWFDAIPLPAGDRLLFSRIDEDNELTKKRESVGVRTYIGTGTVVLTQDDIAGAGLDAAPDQEGKPQPFAMITLTPTATESFRIFTKQNALRRIAILVDDNVIMSARIQDEITGGKLSISLDPETAFDVKKVELQRIVDSLKPHGAAPGPTGTGVGR